MRIFTIFSSQKPIGCICQELLSMEKLLLLLLSVGGVVSSVPYCKLYAESYLKNSIVENTQHMCIAHCLGLDERNKKNCNYSKSSGNVIGECCGAKFKPGQTDKVLLCKFVPREYENFVGIILSDCCETRIMYYSDDYNKALVENVVQTCDYTFHELAKYSTEKKQLEEISYGHHQKLLDIVRPYKVNKVLVIGSWEDETMPAISFSKALESQKSRADFFTQLLVLIKKYEFAGLNVMWLFPGCPKGACWKTKDKKDKDRVIAMGHEVLKPLREMGLKIFYTYSITPDTALYLGDYFSELMPFVDYFLPETDTQAGWWRVNVEFDNSLSFSKDVLTKIASKIQDKQFLAKNIYALSPRAKQYQVTDAKHAKIRGPILRTSKLQHELLFKEYCNTVRGSSNFTFVQSSGEQNYGYSGKVVLIYDDAASLRAKADYAMANMAGMMLIALENDDVLNSCGCGSCPYLRTVAEFLKGRECIFKPCF